ncbi:hypothetical protein MJA45_06950 [Paenibacillus aurantius]|uniref:Uncharacterized protein n=1 Tax=Paenibacillus aurantius TaxID=2918900 RepID=A0AA96RJ16_9BACL|nr:hypothetical protein [Paenibacillus aurantius]WJH32369.1 hypothetical protein N6H14_18420 [Paenibacillus sp. CC-CFT747]WNQ12764.1 hypothetical protein MJA45_06950 [Paenibacillus aurantius]
MYPKNYRIRKLPFIMIGLILTILMSAATASAAPKEHGAKTSPPPISDSVTRYFPGTTTGSATSGTDSSGNMQSMGSDFDPNHQYLATGNVTIGSPGNGNIHYSGSTYASVIVDSISISLTVQRWTGSSWVDVAYSPFWVRFDSPFIGEGTDTVQPRGYYYRVIGYHSVAHNGVTENGTTVGSYYLVN